MKLSLYGLVHQKPEVPKKKHKQCKKYQKIAVREFSQNKA